MRQSLWKPLAAILFVALSSLGCDEAVEPGDALVGSYELVEFDGSPLPAAWDPVTITEGSLEIRNSGVISWRLDGDVPNPNDSNDIRDYVLIAEGMWTEGDGSTLTAEGDGGLGGPDFFVWEAEASLDGDQLTFLSTYDDGDGTRAFAPLLFVRTAG